MRPERDELDRFKNRKTGQAVNPKAKAAPVAKVSAKPPYLLIGLVIVLMCVTGALGFGYVQQEQRISQLGKDLEDAAGFVNQSKLLMARLEGELSETGEELEQSGSAAAKKLAFLDSEMRKLWGVSNDRNRKAIAENKQRVDGLDVRIGKSLDDLSKGQNAFEATLKSQRSTIKSLESQLSLASGELAIVRESLAEDLDALRKEIGGFKAIQAQLTENKKAIASIDSSRKQINERLVDLGQQVNELKLSTKASP